LVKYQLPFFILSLFVSFISFSQKSIKGQVVNAVSGEPLSGSSVFINGSSIGTVADNKGRFELNNIPPGRYELVVSLVGYETNVFGFTSEQLPLNLKIEMKVKVKELDNVTVEPSVEESWEKWGELFLENFIGRVPNAKECKILNTKSIGFRFYRRSNRVIAYSDEPLIIENMALGYKITYQLEQFEVDFKDNSVVFAGYPFFEEIDRNRKGLQRRWKEAREKAFYGSMMHFFRCLYKDSLMQNGYEVRKMKRIPNLEKERIRSVYREGIVQKDSNGIRVLARAQFPKDSSAYYEKIMRQKDYTEEYGRVLSNADSLIFQMEGEHKYLFFDDYLSVTYKKQLEDKEYLFFHRENRKPVFQQSCIWLINNNPVVIDINGAYYPPQEMFSMWYWGWSEKMANNLPADYQPDN
jgi:hypothetical protein